MKIWLNLTLALVVIVIPAIPCLAGSEPAMFPFPIQTFNAKHDATDMSWMNECPAGKNGFIRAKDGHFVDGKGKRIRFLGVNLCFSGAFPDHETADKLAARLAKLGINCVRLHHMDGRYAPDGIWDPAFKDHRHMDAGQLDRLDYLVHKLKAHGVYVDINLHVAREFNEVDGFSDADRLPKHDKGVDNFEPKMIRLQQEYARQLLTHMNPYTKTRYVDEPAVAMIEINNENSLVEHCINGATTGVPEQYLSQLRQKWNDWLGARYGTVEKLRAAWDVNSEPLGDNLLANSDFGSGTDRWTLEAPKPAEAAMEITDAGPAPGVKALHAKLTRVGAEAWHFQVHQTGLDLVDGKPYTVRFKARSDRERTAYAYMSLDESPWSRVGMSRETKLTPEWQSFECSFYADRTRKGHNRLSFNFRSEVGEVWIAEVELRPGGSTGLAADASFEAGNVDLPFFTYTQKQRTDFLDFAARTERTYALDMSSFIKNTLGAKSLVIDSQMNFGGIAGVYRESLMDYGDAHGYWQHPSFPRRSWDPADWYIRNTSMVGELGNDTLTRLALHRVAGKPFVVSEYNHPAPNDYAAECVPMLASFAAHQDWDGIFLFDYHSGGPWERDHISNYFSVDSNPSKIVFLPTAAAIFRRADVSPARSTATLDVPVSAIPSELVKNGTSVTAIWRDAGLETSDAAACRTAIRLVDGGSVPMLTRDDTASQNLSWVANEGKGSLFIVNSAATRGVIGAISGKAVKIGKVMIEAYDVPNKFAAITVTSLDGKAVEQSEHVLITVVGRVENQDMVWNETRTSVGRSWGHGPAMAEPIRAVVTIPGDSAAVEVYALDGGGSRMSRSLTGSRDGNVTLHLGPTSRTLWYEVVIKR